MSTDRTSDTDNVPTRRSEIALIAEDGGWTARDVKTGVASCGDTREEALAMLDEAVALHTGAIGDAVGDDVTEREILNELGVDPDDVAHAREAADGLPEFMR
jgi:predicted RNase H-like HicB family nuclease